MLLPDEANKLAHGLDAHGVRVVLVGRLAAQRDAGEELLAVVLLRAGDTGEAVLAIALTYDVELDDLVAVSLCIDRDDLGGDLALRHRRGRTGVASEDPP